MDVYSASCPEQAQVVDGANGVVSINCPDERVDCSQLAGGVIRTFLITPEMTWWMTFQAPHSVAGMITARNSGCSLQPIDARWQQNFQPGWGGVITSCFYSATGCTSADAIQLVPFVPIPVVWEGTDIYPQTTHNQLFAVLPGK